MCGYSSSVDCVSGSLHGKMIESGSQDETLQIWDTADVKPMGEPFRKHLACVTFVGFTEESSAIVSGADDGTIHRWMTVLSRRISEPTRRCEDAVRNIVLSDDEQKF